MNDIARELRRRVFLAVSMAVVGFALEILSDNVWPPDREPIEDGDDEQDNV